MGDKLTVSSVQETQLTYEKACCDTLVEVTLDAIFIFSIFPNVILKRTVF